MKAIKLDFIKVKKPLFLIQNKEQDENTAFNIKVFLDTIDGLVPDFKRIFATIRNDKCKCWTNIYHIVLDYFLRSGKSAIIGRIKQHESGVSFMFLFPDFVSDHIALKTVRKNLEKIFKSEVFRRRFRLDEQKYQV